MKQAPIVATRKRASITVTTPPWSKQNDMGNGTVLKYRLQYKAKGSSQWTNSTLEHAISSTKLTWDVKGLVINTVYEFRVVLLNKRTYEGDEKWGRPGSVLEARTRCPDVPVPQIIQIATGIESSLTWPDRSYLHFTLKNFTSDGMPSNCFKSLTTWYKGSSDGSFASSTVTNRDNYQYKSENLKANTNYIVYIELNDIDGKTVKSLNSTITTAEDIPGKVTNLLATKQGKTLKVKWSEPDLKNGVITAYYVEHKLAGYGQCEDVNGNPNESSALTYRSYTLPEESVCSFCRYNITVTAATAVGRGEPLVITNQTTAESIPITRPTPPAVQAVSSRQVTFSWAAMPCKDRNGLHFGYSYKLLNGSSVLNASVTNALTVTFTSLDPYTTYRFRIAFTNGAGTGPYTPDVTVTTGEEAPGQVAGINAVVSSTTLKIQWQPPAVPNGLILSYTVGYVLKGFGPASQCSNVTRAWTMKNASASALELVVPACPYCVYDIKVQAVNGAGTGMEKILTDVLTNATAPTVSPLKPKFDSKTSRQVKFSWTEMPCEYRNGPFVSYAYRLHSAGKDVKSEAVTSLTATITGLIPYTTYKFQVAYRNQAGQGPYGNAVNVVTDEDVPPAPGIEEIAGSLTTISVRVVPPDPPHGVITMYSLEIWERGTTDPGKRNSVDILDHIHTFKELRSYTSFKIRAKAWTKKGAGNWSHEIGMITTERVPWPPNTIDAAKITSNSFELKWTPPKYNNGILKDYKVICFPTFSYDVTVNQDKEKYSMETEPGPDVDVRIMEGLTPATKYNCSVAAQTSKGYGPSIWMYVWTEPEKINIPNNLFPGVQLDKTSDTTITVDVKKMPKSFKAGSLRAIRIGVEELVRSRRKRSTPLTTQGHSQILDYKTAKNSGLTIYIAAELNATYTGEFIIGDGKTYGGYYNPPLEPGQKYDVIFGMVMIAGRATTTSYSRFGEAIEVGGGASPVTLGLAIGIPLFVGCLLAVIALIVYFKRRKKKSRAKPDTAKHQGDDPASLPGMSVQMQDSVGSANETTEDFEEDVYTYAIPEEVRVKGLAFKSTDEDGYLCPDTSKHHPALTAVPSKTTVENEYYVLPETSKHHPAHTDVPSKTTVENEYYVLPETPKHHPAHTAVPSKTTVETEYYVLPDSMNNAKRQGGHQNSGYVND